jgi:2-polyprenyl-3-methyl-5-hydroxy-6-metoxy-1,4-benzoquinol methylase
MTSNQTAKQARTAWRASVEAVQEQGARLATQPELANEAFWTARVPMFRAGASESEELEYVRSLLQADDVLMDIGAGAGRLAIPFSESVARVFTIDNSSTMREALVEGASAAGRTNIESIDARWPHDAAKLPQATVTLAANMLYTNDDPIAFIEAMERQTSRLCVIALADRAPRTPDPEVWARFRGEPLAILPGAREFIALMAATGRTCEVETFAAPEPRQVPIADALRQQGWRFGATDSEADQARLRQAYLDVYGNETVPIAGGRTFTAVVSWRPPHT